MERKVTWGDIYPVRIPEEASPSEREVLEDLKSAEDIERVEALEEQAGRILEKWERVEQKDLTPQERKRFQEGLRVSLLWMKHITLSATLAVGALTVASAPVNYGLKKWNEEREIQAEKDAEAEDLVNWQITRYNVTERRDKNGDVVYEHEDPETTRILNYITGRGEMTESSKLACIRSSINDFYDKKGDLTEQIYAIRSLQEMRSFLIKNFDAFKKQKKGHKQQSLAASDMNTYNTPEIFADTEMNAVVRFNEDYRRKMSPKLYSALWNVFKDSGAPMVRWTTSENIELINRSSPGVSSYYDSQNNIIYIDSMSSYSDGIDNIIAEMAHSKNKHTQPGEYRKRQLRGQLWMSAYRTIYGGGDKTDGQVYDSIMYQTPGTEEYVAHSSTESDIKNELEEETGMYF